MQTLPTDTTILCDEYPPRGDIEPVHATLEERHNGLSKRRELVTITVTQEDFRRLKASGGSWPDQLIMALRRYLHIREEDRWRTQMNAAGWHRGHVISFPCAIPKTLSDEIRNLGGRFDTHTIEAVRLFCLGKGDTSNNISQEIYSGPTWQRSLWSAAFGAFSLLLSRLLGQPSLS